MLTLSSAHLTACIAPLGARLDHIGFHDGPNLVLSADPDVHPDWAACYGGVIVGPVANRVTGGRVTIDGHTYQMQQNEGPNCLHSGDEGVHAQVWEVARQSASSVTLSLVLPDGACGLPGRRAVTAQFTLEDAALALEITATSDAHTPLAFAHHPYWALGGSMTLHSTATHYLPVDEALLPTGAVEPVAGGPYGFATPRPLPPEIDHNLCWTAPRRSDAPMATLSGSYARLHIHSNQPGLQVYAGAGLPNLPGIGPFAGCALEPQNWPDALNNAHFPSAFVPKGAVYHQIIRYFFEPAS